MQHGVLQGRAGTAATRSPSMRRGCARSQAVCNTPTRRTCCNLAVSQHRRGCAAVRAHRQKDSADIHNVVRLPVEHRRLRTNTAQPRRTNQRLTPARDTPQTQTRRRVCRSNAGAAAAATWHGALCVSVLQPAAERQQNATSCNGVRDVANVAAFAEVCPQRCVRGGSFAMRRKGLGAGSHACIGLMRSSMPTQLTRSRDLRVRRIFDASMQRHASPAACTCVRTRARARVWASARVRVHVWMCMRRVAPGILAVAARTLRATLRGVLRSRTVVRHRRRVTRSGAAARYRGECGRELKRKAPDQVLWDAAGHLLAEADDSRRQTVFPCVPVGAGVWVCGCVRACEIGCELARVHGWRTGPRASTRRHGNCTRKPARSAAWSADSKSQSDVTAPRWMGTAHGRPLQSAPVGAAPVWVHCSPFPCAPMCVARPLTAARV